MWKIPVYFKYFFLYHLQGLDCETQPKKSRTTAGPCHGQWFTKINHPRTPDAKWKVCAPERKCFCRTLRHLKQSNWGRLCLERQHQGNTVVLLDLTGFLTLSFTLCQTAKGISYRLRYFWKKNDSPPTWKQRHLTRLRVTISTCRETRLLALMCEAAGRKARRQGTKRWPPQQSRQEQPVRKLEILHSGIETTSCLMILWPYFHGSVGLMVLMTPEMAKCP